jgi:beta-N-acetylhexosaminidase
VVTPGIVMPFLKEPLPFALPKMLEREGFAVTMHEPGAPIIPADHDLVLYLFGDETLLTRSRIFVDWLKLSGGDVIKAMERTWHDIPTAMISFGYPYLLYDAPRVPTYINAYSTLESVQRAVLECLVGRAEWNRHNPVDSFCGLEDARY